MEITKKIILNTNNDKPNSRIIIKQGCIDTITLVVTINDKGSVLELPTGTTAKIRMLKPDKKQVLNDCEVVGNNVHVEITQQMQAVAGEGQCEVILFNSEKTFTTVTFPITIEANVHDDSQLESVPEYTTILNILSRVESAETGLNDKLSKTTDLINNDTTGGVDKVASAEVVKVHGQEIDTINDKLANKFPIVEGDFTPGGNIIIAGKLDEGFMGFVQPSEMGKINGTDDYNGESLALAIGLASGTAFNSNVPLMKFHSKGKVLFIPLTGYRYSCSWDKIYEAGAVYGTNDEGLLPPTGRLGTDLSINGNDNSINCTNQYFLGDKTAGQDYADTVGAVGDTLVLKGWGEANNKTVTIVSITDTKIVVSGAALVTEQGGKSSRFYNQTKAVTQNKTVTIGDKQYRVRLIKGSGANPTDSYDDTDRGSTGGENEWNSLILPLHEHAKLGNWNYTQYAKSADGGTIPYWGIGLTDENLRTHSEYGSGSYTWCQETIDTQTWSRVFRGYHGASYSSRNHSWNAYSGYYWRPVLESL